MPQIVVNYTGDIVNGTLELLEASSLKSLVKPGMKVSLKPNMVISKPPSQGATTHPEVAEGIIIYLSRLGIKDIEIIESAWIGDNTMRVYKTCGYERLRDEYGVELFDLKQDRVVKVKSGKYDFSVCEKALATDFLINIPVLKGHCQTTMTCCLKNLKGCIPDREKQRFHTMGLHGPIAWLNKSIKTGFCVIDGICGDLSFEEGGNPVTRNMLICGADPLLLDTYCAGLLGHRAGDIEYLEIAGQIGVGETFSHDTKITCLNAGNKPMFDHRATGAAKRLAQDIIEDGACSACYSALIQGLKTSGITPREKICVGQGFKGKRGKTGCGNCTSGFDSYIKGCPPKALDVTEFLRKI